jgi:glycosyltransferase involved in cell wall biosynthesis
LELAFVAAPRPRGRPAPRVMRALCELVERRGVDVVHGYEWTTALEAYWGPRTRHGVPAVATVMSMAVAPFLPHDMPLIVGTEQIAAHERAAGRSLVSVIEPPVDLGHNAAGTVDPDGFRAAYGLDPAADLVVCVTRLAAELKLEGLLAAIDAVAGLPADARAQLAIVGDGPSRDTVAARVERANALAGRRVAVLTGELSDPRPAYAAADVALGMGGSALRAMAFAKPVVVQGERGFWKLLEPATLDGFLWSGWYGVCTGREDGAALLSSILAALLADPARRATLGTYGRALVEQRFSLERAALLQLEHYEAALAAAAIGPRQRIAAAGASAIGVAAYRLQYRINQARGRSALDDFNSKPVAAAGSAVAAVAFSR